MSITLYKWSKVDLPDPPQYYGGFKEPRLLKAGQYMRALSDRKGDFESATFDFTVSDHDRLVRGLLAGATSRYFINKTVIIRTISDAGRRALQTAKIVAIGIIRDYEPMPDLKFRFKCEDYAALFIGFGRNPKQIPKRTITKAEFPMAPEEKKEDGGTGDPTETGIKTYTDPHPSISPIPPCPDYVQLSDQARDLNQTGTISNGTYGLCEARGWIMYDGNGEVVGEGWTGHSPPVEGDVVWASPDVAEVLEAAVGGENSTLVTVGAGVPILYGDLTDRSEAGGAQCQALYAGSYNLSNGLMYHKFVVAGHAVKAITAVYTENGTTGVGPLTDATNGAGLGGPWVVPGYANWTALIGPNLYEDINGQRFTIIYGKVGHAPADVAAGFVEPTDRDRGVSIISVSVQGIETNGDGTGTLITNLLDQYRHFMLNFGFGDYQSGPWVTASPNWPNVTPAVPVIHLGSFDGAKSISNIRFPGGYIGAGMFGGAEGRISLAEALKRFNISADVQSGFNSKSQYFVSMYDDTYSSVIAERTYLQTRDILESSFSIKDSVAEWENKIVYSHTPLYMDEEWKTIEAFVQDDVSIAAYEETKASDVLEYWFIRSSAQAEEVARRRLTRNKVPPRIAEFTTTLIGLNTDIGDYIGVTHIDGIGPNGWENQPIYVTRHVFDTDKFTVTLEGYDVSRIVASSAVLGDESTMAATWLAASGEERGLFYLGDETTGQMSDGSPIKRLR